MTITGFDLIRGGHGRLCERGTIDAVTERESPCSLPRSQAACPSRPGWPKPTSSGRSGRPQGDELRQAKADATLLWIKAQEDAGLDIVGDGEQSRQHFVHGFLEQVEGIDFEHKVKMGIRDNRYDAMVPQVVGAVEAQGPRACVRGAARARPHHAQAQVHAARPDDHRRHRGRPLLRRQGEDGVCFCRAAQPGSAGLAGRRRGHHPVRRAGLQRLHEGRRRLGRARRWSARRRASTCTTAVHICYGYGIKANVDWKNALGDEWRQYEQIFPALAASSHRAGQPGVLPLACAAATDEAARRQGRDGRRDRRGQRRDRNARAGGRHHRNGPAVRARRSA